MDDVAEAGDNLGVKAGDIVYNMMRMWQGAFGLAMQDCMVSPAYVALVPDEGVNTDFFVQMFARKRSLYLFTSYSYGLTSDRLRLYFKDFAAIKLHVPSLPEQQKIADFLSAVDRKIEQLARRKALLEEYKKGVMQKIFSQKLRFKDENGKSYPKWEEQRLGEVAELISGLHLSPEQYGSKRFGIPYFSGPSDFTNHDQAVAKWTGNCKNAGVKGDILITVKGSGVGTLLQLGIEKVAIGRQLMAIRPVNAITVMLYQFLLLHKNSFEALASGNMIPGLSRSDILGFKLNLPSLPEQQKIADFLSALDAKIEKVAAQIEKSREFKKGLLQQMFA